MTTPKLKILLKVASEVINIFLSSQDLNPTDSFFTISPFYDKDEKNTEVVNITFDNYELTYEFLEPLASKLSKTNIQWAFTREETQFSLALYY
jgi:hypothetical protein